MIRVGALVATGRTSDVYEFGEGAVVKIPRPDVPDHWAVLEAGFAAAVRTLNVPAPAVIDVVVIEGRHAIVFERVEGRSMWERMLDAPDQVEHLGRTLAATQSAIFAAGPPVGLEGMVDRVKLKLGDAGHLDAGERSAAVRLFDELPKGAALLHGDLHPGNLLMTDDGPIVIDWFMAQVLLPSGRSLQRWEALMAASRLSEGVGSDVEMLIALWRGRNGPWSSPLADALSETSD